MGKDLNGRELGKGLCQRKDGRYMVRLSVKFGKPITRYFDNKTKAEKWLIDMRYDIEHNNIGASSQMSLDTWFEYWLNTLHGDDIRYNTRRNYKSYYNRRIKDTIGMMVISDIKPLHCVEVLNECKRRGDTHGSMVKVRAIMRNLFETALDNGIIIKNPVNKRVKAAKTPKKERIALKPQQQKEFLEIAKNYAHYNEFLFVLNTGLRAGELQALKWCDVDFQERTIHIQRTAYYNYENRRFEENAPKSNAGNRLIPLTPTAFDILTQIKESQSVVAIGGYVFLNSAGKRTMTVTYNKVLGKIVRNMNIDKFTMHNLRHTFASRCIENGMQPKILQKILGHEQLSMTMDLYVHVSEDAIRSEMQKISYAI